jgi:hypothetical protein
MFLAQHFENLKIEAQFISRLNKIILVRLQYSPKLPKYWLILAREFIWRANNINYDPPSACARGACRDIIISQHAIIGCRSPSFNPPAAAGVIPILIG